MTTISTLSTAFDALRPMIEADFIRVVTARVESLIERRGADLVGLKLGNEGSRDGDTFRTFRKMISFGSKIEAGRQSRWVNGVDHAAIQAEAARYAADQVAKFVAKTEAKLGELQNVEIVGLSAGSFEFSIVGTLADKRVTVRQSRIINFSNKGTAFHQWPALIYVDGRKVSEAAFRKLAA